MPRKAEARLSVVKDWQPTQDPLSLQFMREDLHRSGLTPEDLRCEPCEHTNFPNIPAYVIHYGATGYWRVRLKLPPEVEKQRGKYRGPHGDEQAPRAYLPHRMIPAACRKASIKYICEGEKKAEKLFKDMEVPVIGIAGCWMWSARGPEPGSRVLMPTLQELLKPEDTVYYIADRDIINPLKLDIGKAAKALQVKLAALNVACRVLVPPNPYKGIDDWLTESDGSFNLEELEEFTFSWFPVQALVDEGVTFKTDKDGNVTSHKQAIPDTRNSSLLASLVLKGDPFVACDKYTGYVVDGMSVSGQEASIELEMAVNQFFPGFSPKREGVARALARHVAGLQHTNMLADSIRMLKWDGTKRLETWLPTAMRLADGQDKGYAARVGLALICGLYQRVTQPGSQCDFMWILHGPQGVGKTTFFRSLGKFPGHDGYASVAANDLTKSDYTMGRILKRAVVLDVDDLESVRGKAHGDIKSFVSRTKDIWREIYVSFVTEEPRGCIITGSTNDAAILTDLTGGRRFLVVSVADIRGVGGFGAWSASLRDLLLAEARERWAELEQTWWNLDVAEINKRNRAYIVASPVADALRSMHENELLIEARGQKMTTASAVSAFMADPRWASPTAIGQAMARLVNNAAMDIRLGQKIKLRVDQAFFDKMPRHIKALYRPAHDVQMMWFYPVIWEK